LPENLSFSVNQRRHCPAKGKVALSIPVLRNSLFSQSLILPTSKGGDSQVQKKTKKNQKKTVFSLKLRLYHKPVLSQCIKQLWLASLLGKPQANLYIHGAGSVPMGFKAACAFVFLIFGIVQSAAVWPSLS
jgi:hypothetical protein